ncbi:MAG: helix-turn-helix protein [Acidobacteriota bacterium]|jgi:transcriptional regulator with XRE-family HTH domain|nr:helix-turn-helix protein [Acidobacteriota bacterium]
MATRGDSSVLRLVVIFLRSQARMTQAQFGKESRVDQAQLSRYESGDVAPSEEVLRRMAKVARIDWPLVVHLRQLYSALLAAAARRNTTPTSGVLDLTILEPVLLAVAPYLIEIQAEPARPTPEEERREAEQIWKALEKYPIPFRRRLIELSPRSGSWALAEQVCEASRKSATGNAEEALELAELALAITARCPRERGSATP